MFSLQKYSLRFRCLILTECIILNFCVIFFFFFFASKSYCVISPHCWSFEAISLKHSIRIYYGIYQCIIFENWWLLHWKILEIQEKNESLVLSENYSSDDLNQEMQLVEDSPENVDHNFENQLLVLVETSSNPIDLDHNHHLKNLNKIKTRMYEWNYY